MTTPRYPISPVPDAPVGTLLQTATVDDGDLSWLDDGRDLYDTYNCMQFQQFVERCTPASKTFANTAGWISGFTFAAYGGVTCKSVGLDQDRMKSEVARVFDQGESTAVEMALMARRFKAQAAANGHSGWAAPTDITPVGGAVKPSLGIALLEGHGRRYYNGAPTVHVPVSIASLFLGVAAGATITGSEIKTKLGSKIVAGAGYAYPNLGPDGTAAPAGEKWLYATGEVMVRRAPVDVRQVMAHSTNDIYVLAERMYVVAVDCYSAAIRVQETA